MSISKDFFIDALKYDCGSYSIMKAFAIVSVAIVILLLSAVLLSLPASAEDVRHAEAYRHIRVTVSNTSADTHANISVKMAVFPSSEAQAGEGVGAWLVILLISVVNIVFLALALRKRPGRIGLKKRK